MAGVCVYIHSPPTPHTTPHHPFISNSHNRLTRLEGLAHLPNLRTLNVARNHLRDDYDDDDPPGEEGGKKEGDWGIAHLAACPALTNVDLRYRSL